MIGMMYLVLTALLALNVSKEILNAFCIVNDGLNRTNKNFDIKNDKTYTDFKAALEKDKAKVQPYHDRAEQTKKLCGGLSKYIEELKSHLVEHTDGVLKAEADTTKLINVNSKDNYDTPTHILIGDNESNPKDGEFTAKDLKKKIGDLRASLISMFADEKLFLPAVKKEIETKIGLQTPDFGMMNGVEESWETGNFYHLPLAAVIVNLSKMQNDVKNAEADVVNALFAAVKGKDFTFDKLTAKVIAPSSYILAGGDYTADVLLVAFNSTQNPKIVVGEIDTTVKGEEKNPLKAGADTIVVPVSGGMGKYVAKTGSEGLQKWSGVIQVEKPGGGFNYYPFASEYMVARPALVVSPTKMNVLYIGVDNPIDISVPGVPAENISPSLSGGTLGSGGKKGSYIARVSGGTEATVNVSAKLNGENKPMGNFKFRVKRVPDPVSFVAGKKGDDIVSKGELISVQGVIPKLENFDFDLKFEVISFDMSMMLKGVFVTESSQSNRVTGKMSSLLAAAGTGTKVYFENVRAKGPDGTVRKIPGVNLKVK